MQRIAPRATDIKGAPAIRELEEAVLAIDDGSSRSTPSFGPGVVMLAAVLVGQNAGVLSSYTRQPRQLVDEVGKRLRRNGVWAGGATYCEWFESEESTSFLLDLNVAIGTIIRPSGAAGPALYKPVDVPLDDEPGRLWAASSTATRPRRRRLRPCSRQQSQPLALPSAGCCISAR